MSADRFEVTDPMVRQWRESAEADLRAEQPWQAHPVAILAILDEREILTAEVYSLRDALRRVTAVVDDLSRVESDHEHFVLYRRLCVALAPRRSNFGPSPCGDPTCQCPDPCDSGECECSE